MKKLNRKRGLMIKLFEEELVPYKNLGRVLEFPISPIVVITSKYWAFKGYHAFLAFNNQKHRFNKKTRIFLLGDTEFPDASESGSQSPTTIKKVIAELKPKRSKIDINSLALYLSNIDNYEVVDFWMSELTEGGLLAFKTPYDNLLNWKALKEYFLSIYWFPNMKSIGPKYFLLGEFAYKYDNMVSLHAPNGSTAIYNPFTGTLYFSDVYVRCGNWIVGPMISTLTFSLPTNILKKISDLEDILRLYMNEELFLGKKKLPFDHELDLYAYLTFDQKISLKILKMGSESELETHPIGKVLYNFIERVKKERGIQV